MSQRVWPFLDRAELTGRVEASLDQWRTTVLLGPAGVGKSRLAAEVLARLDAGGVRTQRIVASPAHTPMPLAPLAGLIGDATGSAAVTALADHLGADLRRGPADPVVLVDDLHTVDEATATVIHQLAMGGRVRVLATARSGMQPSPAANQLLREATTNTVRIGPMDDIEVAAMVETALEGRLDGASRNRLLDLSQGNPLFAREVVEGSIAAGVLTAHAGVWSFTGALSATPALEDLVSARLVPLDDDERLAMELLAVGGRLELDLLSAVVADEVLEGLERMHLVRTDLAGRPPTIDVAHPLHRELLVAGLGPLARLRIHRQLAEADALGRHAAGSGTDLSALRSTVWRMRGGLEVAPKDLLVAARQSRTAGDLDLAAELAAAAARAGQRVDAAFLASWCFGAAGRPDEAIAVLEEVTPFARDAWERALILLRTAEHYWWQGRSPQGRRALALPLPDPPGPWHDLLVAQAGVFDALSGDLRTAVERCEHLADHPEPAVRFVATIALGTAYAYGDRCDETFRVCGPIVNGDAAQLGLFGNTRTHMGVQLNALLQRGDVATACELATAGYQEAARSPSVQTRAWGALYLVQALTVVGDAERVCTYAAEAEELWTRNGILGMAAWADNALAQAQADLGLLEEAGHTLERLAGLSQREFGLQAAAASIARAHVAFARGDRALAAQELSDAAIAADTDGRRSAQAAAWHELARLDLLAVADGWRHWQRPTSRLGALRFDFVHARAGNDGGTLAACGEGFEDCGALLYAAESFALAAQVARRAGDHKEAGRLEGRSGSLAARCSGHSVVLRGRSPSPVVGALSAREHEVARLAAQGLSNRQIAQYLVVSERTVENHLYRVFQKLGVGGRDDLAASLGD